MQFERVIFRVHALQRMFEREVGSNEIVEILKAGEVVEDYPDDTPYASRLLLGWSQERPLHVVAAIDEQKTAIVITVYQPDPEQWDNDFKRRKA